jgi:single-strand DNA-binding protein
MFQQLMLIGNLGNDPEMRYTPSGDPVTSFSLAVNRVWNDRSGQRQEKTIWFRVSAWRKTAEIVSQYASKGSRVLVVGEIEEPRIYTDRNGEQRVSLDVTAQNVRFLSPRGEQAEGIGGGQAAERAGGGTGQQPGNGGGAMTDEDIPF